MAFVNEYVSKEDIEKYGLDELKNGYIDDDRFLLPNSMYQHYWTVNREKEIWLMKIGYVKASDWEHNHMVYTREIIFILNYKGINIKVRLLDSDESSMNYDEIPFKKVWKFIAMEPELSVGIEEKEVKELVKEGLEVFGKDGINWQVPNTIVKLQGSECNS